MRRLAGGTKKLLSAGRATIAGRRYPKFAESVPATVPLSFIVVRYSGEFEHNLATSPCIEDPLNELIVVDNRRNLFFATLSEALLFGVEQATKDLVVLVHEDVVLLPGWQGAFEYSLSALQKTDPTWWMAGVFGWTDTGAKVGHVSGPRGYRNQMSGRLFAPVHTVDEQLIALRRTDALSLDPAMPSIHNIGRDLGETGRSRGRQTYVVDAATIHKFADAKGKQIKGLRDSPKISVRSTAAYLADKSLSDDYFAAKWPSAPRRGLSVYSPTPEDTLGADPPVVLLVHDPQAATRFAELAGELQLFLGNDQQGGAPSEMLHCVYRAVLGKLRYRAAYEKFSPAQELKAAAKLSRDSSVKQWGFMVPETVLLLDEVQSAFPGARYVHLVRDPVCTCLGQPHAGAQPDNPLGQAELLASYRHLTLDPSDILRDPPEIRTAAIVRHHMELALDFCSTLPSERLLTLRFEDLETHPATAYERARHWLSVEGGDPPGPSPVTEGVSRRVGEEEHHVVQASPELLRLLRPLRTRLDYLQDNLEGGRSS